jgi:hypothetical protein
MVFDPVTENVIQRDFDDALPAVDWIADKLASADDKMKEVLQRCIVIPDIGEYP